MEIKQQIRILIYKSTFVPYNFADLEKRFSFVSTKERNTEKRTKKNRKSIAQMLLIFLIDVNKDANGVTYLF